MGSGPSPDAKEAVELDLSQIRGLKRLKYQKLTIKPFFNVRRVCLYFSGQYFQFWSIFSFFVSLICPL
jgi:hypothetical protein